MAYNDRLYIFDKNTKRSEILGDIQTEFNMSFALDGTKDSTRVVVHSFNANSVKPYTIAYHDNSSTWWVVSHDSVDRYQHENGEFYYVHTLDLLGAIELLNARDLTDCAFNQDTYTITMVLNRLFNLSNFEYSLYALDYTKANINGSTLVDYTKTFENYTLLSALREFLNAYNCDAKMTFGRSYNGQYYTLTQAYLYVYSKTGYGTALDSSIFTDVRENRNIDKKSYGGIVVSNAENVISTNKKVYPVVGSIKPSANEYTVTPSNQIIRLPSNVYKVNSVRMFRENVFVYTSNDGGQSNLDYLAPFCASNPNSIDNVYNLLLSHYANLPAPLQALQEMEQDFKEKLSQVYYEFFDVENYDYLNDKYKSDKPIPRVYYDNGARFVDAVLCRKDVYDNSLRQERCMYWERGSNIINCFHTTSPNLGMETTNKTCFRIMLTNEHYIFVGDWRVDQGIVIALGTQGVNYHRVSYQVDYIPMSDLKITLSNEENNKDTQMYNQNGRLTDSNALSKLLLSYSKEITNENITRYIQKVDIIPNMNLVGKIVNFSGTYYVVNNVSLTCYQNESYYFIDGEYSLSKQVAVKSLMVNPNRNIRDYGIPQNYNVKRKQLYKDIYGFTISAFESAYQNYYMPLNKILPYTIQPNRYQNHTAVMNITYDNEINGSNNYSYQLEANVYYLKKSIIEVVDFVDNNIIGYGYQSVWVGFQIDRLTNDAINIINTPISYVDDNGRFKNIKLYFTNAEQLVNDYTGAGIVSSDTTIQVYNKSVFVPTTLTTYIGADTTRYDFALNLVNYNKDANEVPVFEYIAQIKDTNEVLVGENILVNKDDELFSLYTYHVIPKSSNVNDNNWSAIVPITPIDDIAGGPQFYVDNGCFMAVRNATSLFAIELYSIITYNNNTGGYILNISDMLSKQDILELADWSQNDLVIVKHRMKQGYQQEHDLFMVIKDVSGALNYQDVDDSLHLKINHYKN